MEVICLIEGPVRGPYVYLIQYKDYLYIGETQSHPVKRWADHISNKSNFHTRLLSLNENFNIGSVRFYSIYVGGMVASLKRYPIKQATQAIEHHMHCYFSEQPSFCGGNFKLVSDTEKTAPRKFYHWDVVDGYVQSIIENLRLKML